MRYIEIDITIKIQLNDQLSFAVLAICLGKPIDYPSIIVNYA